MKKWKKMLAALLAMAVMLPCIPICKLEAKASNVSGKFQYESGYRDADGAWWPDENAEGIGIIRYTGKGWNVTVPQVIDGKKVIDIGNRAFDNCKNLTGISIPDTVKGIGEAAFGDCTKLTSITIPASVVSINYSSFEGCIGLKSIKVDAKNPIYDSRGHCNAIIETKANRLTHGCKNTVIPSSVKSIGIFAFAGCTGLTGITIPVSVTTIESHAFARSGLKKIAIPSSVKSIKSSVFSNCKNLVSVTLPRGIKSLEYGVFSGCSKLKKIAIPANVKTIDWYAFSNCTSLTSVTIPGSVTSIGSGAFSGCSSLKSVTIPGSATSIDFGAFNGCSKKLVICGKSGSKAEKYAKYNNIAFRISSSGPKTNISCKKTSYKVTYGTKPFEINAESESKMTFSSSNPKIATVDKNTGIVTVKNTGVVTITIKTRAASRNVTVKVSPKKLSVKTLTAHEGGKLSVKWNKDKRATGYQVQVSATRDFKKIIKTQETTKNSCTISKLGAGKKYYVRIRSYKKSGKQRLYGSWSSAKLSSKIKK